MTLGAIERLNDAVRSVIIVLFRVLSDSGVLGANCDRQRYRYL
jgi:hypothetical protein